MGVEHAFWRGGVVFSVSGRGFEDVEGRVGVWDDRGGGGESEGGGCEGLDGDGEVWRGSVCGPGEVGGRGGGREGMFVTLKEYEKKEKKEEGLEVGKRRG